MRCLTDTELQAAVDNEGGEAIRSHLERCEQCRARADERRLATDTLLACVNAVEPSPATGLRVRNAIASAAADRAGGVRGATALRASWARPWWPRAAVISSLATAAAVVLVVQVVLPRFGAPTALSASEILGRSLQTLSAGHGIELLEYELTLDAAHGRRRIEQLVDRDHPARFRFSNFGPDGVLESAISQDPAAGRRSHLVRIDGRNYLFNFTSPDAPFIPIPQMAQAQVEAVITMMQATSDQKLTLVDTPHGTDYVIQLPPVTPANGAAMLELYQARTVVDGRDFRVTEFEASGAMLKQPYTVSFKLIRRTMREPADVPPDEFSLPSGPDDVVLTGEATIDMFADLVGTALRELARSQSGR